MFSVFVQLTFRRYSKLGMVHQKRTTWSRISVLSFSQPAISWIYWLVATWNCIASWLDLWLWMKKWWGCEGYCQSCWARDQASRENPTLVFKGLDLVLKIWCEGAGLGGIIVSCHLRLMALSSWTWDIQLPLVLLLHLFHKRTFRDDWHGWFVLCTLFLSNRHF